MKTATDILMGLRAAGLTQSEIARLTGIPQPRISRWVNGNPAAGANDALRLVELYESVTATPHPSKEVGHE
ncbi:helix-turn-helix transcriptional regulator [Alcaligenaceae bacterium]|nr:helix-turn-helix transcriptional regulator [Alcaligenaceae bacterium]